MHSIDISHIKLDYTRDANLTTFGKETLNDRYLLKDENYQQMFARISAAFGDNHAHAQRMYDYMSNLWFMPATPILSNGGTNRGLPISCFLVECEDTMDSIEEKWSECVTLAKKGGGIGFYYGNVRSIGEPISNRGHTSGVIPFMKVQDSLTLAVSQGSLRRGSAAVYLPISHPEIEEFVELRKPTGGDFNRRCLNLHHGITIDDKFMHAVLNNEDYELISPHTNEPVLDGNGKPKVVNARNLWIKIITMRVETGEPYIVFIDTVNDNIPLHHKKANLKVTTSNLCSEITLPTGMDYLGKSRTAVCCLSSLNLEKWDEWKYHPKFIDDVMRFLDNVLQNFIDTAPDKIKDAKYSAMRERSVGLGVMGFHSLLQQKNMPWESMDSRRLNKEIFKHIREEADKSSKSLAKEKGACPDAKKFGVEERFSNKLSIAPTATISIICGGASPGIEPTSANVYVHKTLSGSTVVHNRYLENELEALGLNNDKTWTSITVNQGSIQHLQVPRHLKQVFKTAMEIDQRWVIQMAADRAPMICQSQSVNIFLRSDASKAEVNDIHMLAWRSKLKSLYYCRSRSLKQSDTVDKQARKQPVVSISPLHEDVKASLITDDVEICESCQ